MENPFALYGQSNSSTKPEEAAQKFKDLIASAEVFVFMKGTADFPQCGFSANTVGMLQDLGVDFKTFDILLDPTMRQAVKEISGWPTYPQVYFKGELLGGNDVLTEMYQNGELKELLGKA